MTARDAAVDYANQLRAAHDTLGAFLALLERERAVLADVPVSIDALGDITAYKQTLAAELDRLEDARQARVAEAGHDRDLAGGAALAEAHDCQALWYGFIERVEKARVQNQANGLAIAGRLDFAERSVDYLRRASAKTLYAADGQRRTATGQRIQSGA